jgi:hypothetical protein
MVFDADASRTELRNVRAPNRLFDPVTQVLGGLNRKVLRESAKLAKARAGGEPCTIQRDDLMSAVRDALAQATNEIEKALDDDESGHFRNAS